jgi:hypothetical protein
MLVAFIFVIALLQRPISGSELPSGCCVACTESGETHWYDSFTLAWNTPTDTTEVDFEFAVTDMDDGGGSHFGVTLCDASSCWANFEASGTQCYRMKATLDTATSTQITLTVTDGNRVQGAPLAYRTEVISVNPAPAEPSPSPSPINSPSLSPSPSEPQCPPHSHTLHSNGGDTTCGGYTSITNGVCSSWDGGPCCQCDDGFVTAGAGPDACVIGGVVPVPDTSSCEWTGSGPTPSASPSSSTSGGGSTGGIKDKSRSPSVGVIVGAIAGGLAVIGLVGAGVMWRKRQRSNGYGAAQAGHDMAEPPQGPVYVAVVDG